MLVTLAQELLQRQLLLLSRALWNSQESPTPQEEPHPDLPDWDQREFHGRKWNNPGTNPGLSPQGLPGTDIPNKPRNCFIGGWKITKKRKETNVKINPGCDLSPEPCQRNPDEILMKSMAGAVSHPRFPLSAAPSGMRNIGKASAPTALAKAPFGSGEGIYSEQNLPSTGRGSFPAHPKALAGNAPHTCLISTAKMRFLLMRIHSFPLSCSFVQGRGDSFMSGLLQPREAVAAWKNARTASLEKASERLLGLRTASQELILKVSDGAVTGVHRDTLKSLTCIWD